MWFIWERRRPRHEASTRLENFKPQLKLMYTVWVASWISVPRIWSSTCSQGPRLKFPRNKVTIISLKQLDDNLIYDVKCIELSHPWRVNIKWTSNLQIFIYCSGITRGGVEFKSSYEHHQKQIYSLRITPEAKYNEENMLWFLNNVPSDGICEDDTIQVLLSVARRRKNNLKV